MYQWKRWKIEEIKKDDEAFPKSLRKTSNCPERLYFRGNWQKELFEKSLAIVGSRRMTRYGREVTERFMPELVANKITVVSGFMYGIDTEAHKQCVELGGKTVAVLGGGLDFLTPEENDELYSKILETGGLVISEYEKDFKPTLWSFPQRNRIVAGLSNLGILVVEAGLKSGSLITAKLGRQQGKDIWAVPGQIVLGNSEGTNWLIKNGWGKITTEVGDILGKKKLAAEQKGLFEESRDKTETEILKILKTEEMTMDELARITQMPVAEISVKLSLMAMRGVVEEEAGKYYLL